MNCSPQKGTVGYETSSCLEKQYTAVPKKTLLFICLNYNSATEVINTYLGKEKEHYVVQHMY